jgi:hypothetical protein
MEVGDTFSEVAVRASCWSMSDATTPDGLVELSGPDPSGDRSFYYGVTGVAEWSREPATVLLRVGELGLLAEPHDANWVHDGGLSPKPDATAFRLAAEGERVTAVATLQVMAAYETEAFDFPDVRRDWIVRGLKVEHRELVASAEFPDSREPGRILQVDDIPRMLRWADASRRDHATYLLDLEPLHRGLV